MRGWEIAFAAMSIALGEADDVVAGSVAAAAPGVAARLDLGLDRAVATGRRAQDVARVLGAVALDVERMDLAWR